MAIDVSTLQVGPGYLYDPNSKKYYQGSSQGSPMAPTGDSAYDWRTQDPNYGSQLWGATPGAFGNYGVGSTQWNFAQSGQGQGTNLSDFTNIPDNLKGWFAPGTNVQSYTNGPQATQVTQAPDEGFMGSFKYVAPFFLGAAAPFLMGGAAGASGLSGLAPGESALAGSGVWSGGAPLASGVSNGGGMWDWFNNLFSNPSSGGDSFMADPFGDNAFDYSQFNPQSEVYRTLSDLPPATNMQDMMTKLDSTPSGKALLNTMTGGWGDAAGSMTLRDLINGSSSLKSITGGNDLLKLLGSLGAAGLGAYGSSKQASSLAELANKYADMGAPYRAMLAKSYADPSSFLANDPAIQAAVNQGTNALARSLSTKGNPAQNGTALTDIQNYATQNLYGQLGNERNRLANFGGLSGFNAAAPTLDAQAVGQQGNVYNALGYGLQQVTNPQPSLTDLWKSLNTVGLA